MKRVILLLVTVFTLSASYQAKAVVDIPHTSVKDQSLGNCWLYAATGWLESLAKRATLHFGQYPYNISESYLTYRYLEDQLMSPYGLDPDEGLTEGGNFSIALRLIKQYGIMWEGTFIPEEQFKDMSSRQERALSYLNKSLKTGALNRLVSENLRSSEKKTLIRTELNKAFQVNLNNLRNRIMNTTSMIVDWKETRDGSYPITLYDMLTNENFKWKTLKYNGYNKAALELRLKKALNKEYPVIISWYVDFNAVDDSGIFSLFHFKENGGEPGRSGGHLSVMKDYNVMITNPQTGAKTFLGDGPSSIKEKVWAEKYGKLDSIVIKNSWGRSRSSYRWGRAYGYSKIKADYLFGEIPTSKGGSRTGMSYIVLPPGF